MSRIIVTIDRVTLHGLDPAERDALVAALRRELARVLADPASGLAHMQSGPLALAVSRHAPVLRLGPLTREPGPAGARRLGAHIARGIGDSVSKRGARTGKRGRS